MFKKPGIAQVSPTPEALNPYVHLLARSLRRAGATCEVKNRFSLRWLLRSRREIGLLHFHWAEHLCSASSPTRVSKDFVQLIGGVLYAKARGCRIVYTVHNLEPHSADTSRISLAAHGLLLRQADALHVHDEYALSHLRNGLRAGRKIFLVPHGHYIGAYPNECSRSAARTRLGVGDSAFVYLFLGQMRPHKGIERLVDAFRLVARSGDRLILAGWAPQPGYSRQVQRITEGDARIMVFPQFVANERIQSFLNAADVCVLPYQTITTSGAAILALSFGKPVIAPRIGGFPHLLQEGAGILYDPEKPGLQEALARAQHLDLQSSSNQAIALALRLDWDVIAAQHLSEYERLLQSSSILR